MRALILGFIQITMRSLVLMAVMLTICLSIITREFPPDFRRIFRTYEQLQSYNIAATTKAPIMSSQPSSSETNPTTSEESEIEKLSDLYEKRAMIGRSLLDPQDPLKTLSAPANTSSISSSTDGELQILRARLLTCEDQLRLYENLDTDTNSSKE